MALYFAQLRHVSWKQTAEDVVNARVCECCQTTRRRHGRRGASTAFRDRSPKEIRDIHVSRLEQGQVDAGASAPRRQLGDRRVPGERSGAQRARPPGRGRMVQRARTTRASAFAAFSERCRPHVGRRRSGSTMRRRSGTWTSSCSTTDRPWRRGWSSRTSAQQFRMRRVEPSGARSRVAIAGTGDGASAAIRAWRATATSWCLRGRRAQARARARRRSGAASRRLP